MVITCGRLDPDRLPERVVAKSTFSMVNESLVVGHMVGDFPFLFPRVRDANPPATGSLFTRCLPGTGRLQLGGESGELLNQPKR